MSVFNVTIESDQTATVDLDGIIVDGLGFST